MSNDKEKEIQAYMESAEKFMNNHLKNQGKLIQAGDEYIYQSVNPPMQFRFTQDQMIQRAKIYENTQKESKPKDEAADFYRQQLNSNPVNNTASNKWKKIGHVSLDPEDRPSRDRSKANAPKVDESYIHSKPLPPPPPRSQVAIKPAQPATDTPTYTRPRR